MEKLNCKDNNKREKNIEFLKVISMFMIVLWHFYVHGLNIANIDVQTDFVCILNYGISQLILVICSICVNLFVLVTGYFLINKGFKTIRFTKIWFSTVFYSLIIDIILYFSNADFDIMSNIWRDIMPISNDTYWFVKQYLRLIIIAPILSFFFSKLSPKAHHIIMVCILTSVLFLISKYPFGGTRYMTGHSIICFIMLFITGGYLHLYGVPYKWMKSIKTYWFLVVITWAYTISYTMYEYYYHSHALHHILYEYNTFPFLLSIILFLKIKDSNLKKKEALRHFNYIAPLTFGVYLIHDNNNIRSLIWDHIYSWVELYNSILLTPIAIVVSFTIFTICISIDHVRKELFRVLRIDFLLCTISNYFDYVLKTASGKYAKILNLTNKL